MGYLLVASADTRSSALTMNTSYSLARELIAVLTGVSLFTRAYVVTNAMSMSTSTAASECRYSGLHRHTSRCSIMICDGDIG
jgi:hypothetical protein